MDDSDLLVLIDLVQSHTTLEVLELGTAPEAVCEYDDDDIYINHNYITNYDDSQMINLPKLMEIAENSSQLKFTMEDEYYSYLPYDDNDYEDMMTQVAMKIKRRFSW